MYRKYGYCLFAFEGKKNSKFSSLLLELHRLEGVCKGLLLFEGERLIPIFEEDVHVLIIRISYIISYIMLLVA